ncbi:serine/threonine-protein kinase PknK [Sandaracinus amylolyticus]|uniref:serine/threonine-protein kinase n=1 Tax=Sandaracinus amylolyticus TaxID=927083 RepID=UPI001F438C6F|nr:serine/threonine-protein kinase [Sandaracinus amylolyticus]UJR84046.1 Hypothetical protein I5071_61170 [Sandaracinus amylolyticus]
MRREEARPGTVLDDRFVLEQLAGAGGMGEVHRARDRRTGERVALKLLYWSGEEHERRFLREGHLLSRLEHPGIVRYVAHATAPTAYLAMEWLEGEDVGRRLARAPLTLRESLELGRRVAEALDAAHQRGVVHRDVKPSNVFLVGGEVARVKVLDFGIARQLHAATRAVTMTGQVVGTIGYMAPEQAGEGRDIDASADVFSLGCVLFECLTGRAPFAGDRLMEVLAKILLADPPRISDVREDVPIALDNLVHRMMQKEPSERPAMLEIAAALDSIASDPDLGDELRAKIVRAAEDEGPAVSDDEQRLMSVVLADEDLRARATRPTVLADPDQGGTRELAAAADTFGGRLDILANGCPIVVLAGSGVAIDLAARAARCALAMRRILPRARIAIAMGRGDASAAAKLGDVVTRAEALLELAPGEQRAIRIDQTTAGLLDTRFELGGDADGLELVSERTRAEPARNLLGKPAPFEGREREMAMLEAAIDECFGEPLASAILVTAPAGAGKSRLAHELLRAIEARGEPVSVWMARGEPIAAGSSFGMLGQIVRHVAGLVDGERPEVWRHKLVARVARHVPASESQRVAEFLGEMVGARFPDEGRPALRAARDDGALLGEQMLRAWETFVAAECAVQPVVVVLEDLHWGDLPTVRFVDATLRTLRDRPFLALALARPEVATIFPDLWSERRMQHVRLSDLTQRAARKLVREVLGDRADDATTAALIERAGGNAFYLEELIRAVAEGRGNELPDTVLAMAQARLERLGQGERRILRAASVFGGVFWVGGVAALLSEERREELEATLDDLAQRELVTRHPGSRFRDERELSFRHVLVRDAAYGMLTTRDAKLAHRLAGAWLEAAGERDAIVLAQHLERGGEPQGAVVWYLWAAEQALEGDDLASVIARAERGVECGASGAMLGELRLLQAEALGWGAKSEDHSRLAEEALSLSPPGSGPRARAAAELAVAGCRLGDHAKLELAAKSLLEELPRARGTTSATHALAVARTVIEMLVAGRADLAEPMLRAMDGADAAHEEDRALVIAVRSWLHAVRALFTGDPEPYVREGEAIVDALEECGQLRYAVIAGVHLAIALAAIGWSDRAVEQARRMNDRARAMGLVAYAERARAQLVLPLARRGEIAEAEAIARACLAEAMVSGDPVTEARARVSGATISLMRGDVEGATREAESVVAGERFPPGIRAEACVTLARARLARGDAEGALEICERGLALAGAGSVAGDVALRLVRADALIAAGRGEDAQRAIAEAAARVRSRAAAMRDERVREAYLGIAEHAEAVGRLSR